MELPWLQIILTAVAATVIALCVVVLTFPTAYTQFKPGQITEDDFSDADRRDEIKSGYAYFKIHKNGHNALETQASVTVVVLGDLGRSPRMQYHALSIATHGGRVNLVGYVESEVHPDITSNRFITIIPIRAVPGSLRTDSKLLFPLIAPLKVLWQVYMLFHALTYHSTPTKWMLVQNPPSIPTLAVAQAVCLLRKTKLVVDWHNFGYSILALRLGESSPLVKLSAWLEGSQCQGAAAHFAVTNAMCQLLKDKWGVTAQALHDRPAKDFQPLLPQERLDLLRGLPETAQYAEAILNGEWRLIVSSTSWTPDEDFSILLTALEEYSALVEENRKRLPNVLAIITGKGPMKQSYLSKISQLYQKNKLKNVVITTAWLTTRDYALLLGSADLGISLHTSSSGVDLPMKVVDMFGCGLPVAGYGDFAAWSELVRENDNGRGFKDSAGLRDILVEVFGTPAKLKLLREGALKECDRRWNDEWMPIAGALFQLRT